MSYEYFLVVSSLSSLHNVMIFNLLWS